MEMELLSDRVLILVDRNQTGLQTTPEGLFSGRDRRVILGSVLAVGPGRRSADDKDILPMRLKVGQRVLLGQDGVEFDVGSKTYRVVREEAVLGVLPS